MASRAGMGMPARRKKGTAYRQPNRTSITCNARRCRRRKYAHHSTQAMTRDASGLLRHPIKRILQQRQIGRLAEFLPSAVDPLLLQRILGRPILLVEDAEDAGEFAMIVGQRAIE